MNEYKQNKIKQTERETWPSAVHACRHKSNVPTLFGCRWCNLKLFGQQSWLWRDLSIKEHITLSSHLAMIPCKPHVYIKITRISRRRRPWPWVIIKPKYCKDCFWYTCANFSQPIYVQRHWFRANLFAMYLYDVAFVIQGLVWGRPPPPEIWDYIW